MLAGQRNKVHCRDVTGPKPHSVAVLAKQPLSRPPDYLIIEEKKQDDARKNVLEYTKDHSAFSVKLRWEKKTDQKLVSATIERRVHKVMEQYEMSVDERRERLRELLESEERELWQEMDTKKDNMPERQARMRERAKYLQEKKESERQKVVAEKLDRLFREQSQELRAALKRQQQFEVCTERAAQIQTLREKTQLQQEEEMLFAQLWEGDRLAKEQREKMQAQHQKENNLQQLAFLRTQMEASEQQRLQAKQLKAEEAQLLHDQTEIIRLEDERECRQQLENKESWRRQLDNTLRQKLKILARRQREELELDLSILEKLLKQVTDNKKEEDQRKLELREEQYRYRQYLADQLEKQRQHEAEMAQMMDAEAQRMWNRRAEQHRLAKEARDRLMKDVLDTWHLQIQEKLERNAQKQAELAKERDELNRVIQENKLLDEQEKTCLREACQKHQAHLTAQILEKQRLCDIMKDEKDQEIQRSRLEQEEYNQKVQEILSRPTSHTTAVHPFRRRPTTN